MQRIVVNGIPYSSVDEMPEEVRKLYQEAVGSLSDANRNGIPDILEGGTAARSGIRNISIRREQAAIIGKDGKIYSDISELPPEERETYARAMAKAAEVLGDENRNGIPDMLEAPFPYASAAAIPADDGKPAARNFRVLASLLLLILALVLAGFILYYLLHNGEYAKFNL